MIVNSWQEPGATVERLLSFGRRSYAPMVSTAGDLLAFTQETRDGPQGSLLRAGQQEAVQLGKGEALALSPDGRRLLCALDRGSARILRLLPTGAGEARELPGAWSNLYEAWFTPDGAKLLLHGTPAPHQLGDTKRPYLLDLASGQLRLLSWRTDDLYGPISPDGRKTFAWRAPGPGEPDEGFQMVDLETGSFQPVPATCKDLQHPCGWTPDGTAIWFFRRPLEPTDGTWTFLRELWHCELNTGKVSKVREIPIPRQAGAGIFTRNFMVNPRGDSYSYVYSYPLDIPTDLYRLSGLH